MVLIFDLDDTLYEEFSFVRSGFNAVASHGEREFGWDAGESLSFMLKHLTLHGRGKVFNAWLCEHGALTKKRVAKCIKIYRYHNPAISLNIEIEQLLKRYSRAVPLYLVTDGHKVVQQNKIEALGLHQIFKRCLITHRFGIKNAKPSLFCFERIQNIEKCNWSDMVYVADNPAKDFLELNAIGANTVRVLTGAYKDVKASSQYDGRMGIKSVCDLPTLLPLAEDSPGQG